MLTLWLVLILAGPILQDASRVGYAQEPQQGQPQVHLLTIGSVINPLSARYLVHGLEQAAASDAEAVVLRLDTPGGLVDSTREITQAMLHADVPVVVYVAPSGARAASAGMFITIAGHVAVMAPATNIGAAHPVGLGGQTDPELANKLANDAAAMARSIAVQRGRNADWAEQAVRESVSITADEAVEQRVIDLVAADLSVLLNEIAGSRPPRARWCCAPPKQRWWNGHQTPCNESYRCWLTRMWPTC
jgi:membrane-bound serine protease (ClpP class)